MKVLVTGGTGFIGGNLARELVKQGFQVRALVRKGANLWHLSDLSIELAEGDLLNKASLESALKGCEALFHTAAVYTFWTKDPRVIYETNVQGTANILAAAVDRGIKRIVYTSSESVVGCQSGAMGREDMEGSLGDIQGDYKRSKFLAEQNVSNLARSGVPVVIVNPTTPIGPYDVKPTPTGRIVTGYLNHEMFACVNTGLNVVDVEDVAKGHILAFEKGQPGARYILGNCNLSLREVFNILARLTGIPAPRFQMPVRAALAVAYVDEFVEGRLLSRPPRIPIAAVQASRKTRYFDCSKARNELGMPQTPIEESFAKAINWFRQNGYAK